VFRSQKRAAAWSRFMPVISWSICRLPSYNFSLWLWQSLATARQLKKQADRGTMHLESVSHICNPPAAASEFRTIQLFNYGSMYVCGSMCIPFQILKKIHSHRLHIMYKGIMPSLGTVSPIRHGYPRDGTLESLHNPHGWRPSRVCIRLLSSGRRVGMAGGGRPIFELPRSPRAHPQSSTHSSSYEGGRVYQCFETKQCM